MITKLLSKWSVILLLFISFLNGQTSILVVDSFNKKIVQLSGTDGSVINPNFIDLSSHTSGHLKGIVNVNNKIWISGEGTMGKIFIYNLDGTYSSTIYTSASMNNIRGLNVVNNEVWAAVGGTNGGLTNIIKRFDFAGNFLGSNPTSIEPFDVIDGVSNAAFIGSFYHHGIQKMAYDGTIIGNLVAPGVLSGIAQMSKTQNGNLLLGTVNNSLTSGNPAGIYLLSSVNGNILNFWNISAFGLVQSDNGNIIYSSGNKIYSLNTTTGISSLILSGTNFQYMTKLEGTLSINESEAFIASIYPNPTKDKIHIKSKSSLINAKIYSTAGQISKTFNQLKGTSNLIDISDLVTGNYILTLENTEKEIKSFKIVKE